jgi:hypothetical protein
MSDVNTVYKSHSETDTIPLAFQTSMDQTADLDNALGFVIRRVEEEATRSGEPLSDEQRFLLNHLPENSALPQNYGADPESPIVLVPRDALYERLCAVAKAAYQYDLRLNPASDLDWDLAAAVSKLHRHPMAWLLSWAGLKVRRPWWDRWLLIIAALLLIFCFAVPMLLALNQHWTRFQWSGIATAFIAILVLLHFVSRRIEEWQLKQTIERCRRGSTSY